MFVTVGLDTIFYSKYTYVWSWPIYAKFLVSNSIVYSAVVSRLEAK